MRVRGKTTGLVATGIVGALVATLFMILPIDIPAIGGNGLSLVKPVLAQQATAFPSDEAGISAYVNVGQAIDLAKAKNAMRGIQAEGGNYIIGIIELPGLPEEEFPHMYISSDGWILAYYSKFAPSSRIFQWYGYAGGTITTTTLQDTIAKICPTIGVNFSQAEGTIGYYHFKYPEATQITIAVERIDEHNTNRTDTINFSIPYEVTLYEGSWSHSTRNDYYSKVEINGTQISRINDDTGLECDYLEDQQVMPGKLYTMELYNSSVRSGYWGGVAVVFIYR